MDENQQNKIAAEDVRFYSSDIAKPDERVFFDSVKEQKRREKEEQKRLRIEAKKIAKESKKSGGVKLQKQASSYVPMSSEKKDGIRKGVLVGGCVLVAVCLVVGLIYMFNTFWKPNETTILSDEERSRVINEISTYYNNKSASEIDEDAKDIYQYLGDTYNKYEDKDIRLACLYRRIVLLKDIEFYTPKVLEDAKTAEKMESSVRSAGWVAFLYRMLGDEENAAEYDKLTEDRIRDESQNEQPGEG